MLNQKFLKFFAKGTNSRRNIFVALSFLSDLLQPRIYYSTTNVELAVPG